jgi:hypothetical protein
MKKSCGNCPQHCPFLRDERTWPGHVARSVDDPLRAFQIDAKRFALADAQGVER